MALQVWLPGTNGTLLNQGLYKLPNPSYNSMSEFTLGKLGKAIKGNVMYHLSSDIFGDKWSVACWIKFISGYSQYNNIILCLNTSESEDSKFYLSIVNNTYLNIGRGGSSGVTYTLSGGFIIDTWYHIAATCDGTKTSLYLNGNLVNSGNVGSVKSALNLGIGCRSTNDAGTNITGFSWPMNDVRIYDHCLSPKEVKEISKGLVLHYKLSDEYIESTTNLCSNTRSGWNNSGTCVRDYNSSTISNRPTPEYVYSTTATSDGSMAITFGNTSNLPSKTIVASTYCWLDGPQDSQAVVYLRSTKTDSSVGSLYYNGDANPNNWPKRQWIRISSSAIATASDATTFYLCTYITKNNEIRAFNGWQIEEKDHITAWVSPGTTRTSATTVYDSSGYQNNGTLIGNLSINNDTPRYNNCTKNLSEYLLNSVFDFPESKGITFACWMNLTAWGSQISGIWATSTNSTTTPSDYSTTTCNHRDSGFDMRGTNGTTYRLTCGNADIPLNTWKHIVVTHDGTNAKLYINGSLVRTLSVPTSLVGFKSLFLGWSNAGGVNRRCQGSWSDFRIYATALSESDIKELYNTSGYITSNGAVCGYELEENYSNMLSVENYGIETKLWLNGLSSYTQSKCLCTLTDNGYRIYREPNLVYSSAGSVMWGGFVLRNTDNRYGFTKGQTYILQFEVKGLSSNNAKDVYWTNQVGWGGGGLEPQPSNVIIVNPVTLNFNSSEWKTFIYKWTINDEVYKTCTSSYSGFTSGTVYVSYRDFKFGFDYRDTGSLGTDLYIRNIRMYNITDNKNISILKSGVIESGSVVERLDSSTKFLTGNVISTDNLIEI